MVDFDVYNPLANITPRFTEEKLEEFKVWFDEVSKPLLTINDGEPINVITVEELQEFLALKKLHRRSFRYPSYADIMTIVEFLKADVFRVVTWEQFIYILNKFVVGPEIKHELLLAFKVFDSEKRTFLELDELGQIVTSTGDKFSESEAIEILRDANVSGDGNVFYEDFIESMFGVTPELYELETDYLYVDPDEDPSVEPEPEPVIEVPELPPAPPPPPPPPPPAKSAPAKSAPAKSAPAKGKKKK